MISRDVASPWIFLNNGGGSRRQDRNGGALAEVYRDNSWVVWLGKKIVSGSAANRALAFLQADSALFGQVVGPWCVNSNQRYLRYEVGSYGKELAVVKQKNGGWEYTVAYTTEIPAQFKIKKPYTSAEAAREACDALLVHDKLLDLSEAWRMWRLRVRWIQEIGYMTLINAESYRVLATADYHGYWCDLDVPDPVSRRSGSSIEEAQRAVIKKLKERGYDIISEENMSGIGAWTYYDDDNDGIWVIAEDGHWYVKAFGFDWDQARAVPLPLTNIDNPLPSQRHPDDPALKSLKEQRRKAQKKFIRSMLKELDTNLVLEVLEEMKKDD